MEWVLGLLVVSVLIVAVVGLYWMRNRPVRDADGNVVDEYGRPIQPQTKLSGDAVRVLHALRHSTEYLSGYDLRRHVDHLSRQEFYAIIADLEHRELITSKIRQVGTHNVRQYLLTDYGMDIFS